MIRARFRLFSGAVAVSLVAAASTALAQPETSTPKSADSAPSTAQPVDAMPEVPLVTDPMLTPPPDTPVKITIWADALARIQASSPDYISNYESVRRAEAQTRIALASLLPTVNGQGGYEHNFLQTQIPFNGQTLVTPPPDAWMAQATAAWTPLNARALYDYESSKRSVDVAKLSFEDRRRQIAEGAVSAMLATLAASRVAELNRVGLKAALERLHLTEARLEYGQGTPLDVDRANADVASSRRAIINGDETLRRARESLGIALGSRDPVTVSTDLDLEAFERAVATTCRLNDAIEARSDVAAARALVDVAKRTAKSAELAPLPTIGVASQAVYTSAPVLAPNGTVAIEALLTIPFYDGGARYGQLRDARAAAIQAEAALTETRLNAVVASARAQRSVEVSRADRDVSKTERDLAARVDMRTREAYARGRGTSLDLVTSAQALRLAEINLAILDFQLAEARADAALENAECAY